MRARVALIARTFEVRTVGQHDAIAGIGALERRVLARIYGRLTVDARESAQTNAREPVGRRLTQPTVVAGRDGAKVLLDLAALAREAHRTAAFA